MTKYHITKTLLAKMPLNLSIKDIDSIRYFWQYFSIFLITPWYDFNHNAPFKPAISKVYGTCILSIKIFSTIYFLIRRFLENDYKFFYITQQLNYTLCSLNLLILTCFTTFKSTFGGIDNWNKIFVNLQYLDRKLYNKGKTEKRLWKNFYLRFIIQQVVFMSFTLYQMYVWSQIVKTSFSRVLFTSYIFNYFFEYGLTVLLCCLTQIIKTRYKNLNKKVLKIFHSPKITEQKRLVHYHSILGETIEIFNKISGFQIVLIIFDCGMQIVGCLNFPFSLYSTSGKFEEYQMIVSIFVLLTLQLVSLDVYTNLINF